MYCLSVSSMHRNTGEDNSWAVAGGRIWAIESCVLLDPMCVPCRVSLIIQAGRICAQLQQHWVCTAACHWIAWLLASRHSSIRRSRVWNRKLRQVEAVANNLWGRACWPRTRFRVWSPPPLPMYNPILLKKFHPFDLFFQNFPSWLILAEVFSKKGERVTTTPASTMGWLRRPWKSGSAQNMWSSCEGCQRNLCDNSGIGFTMSLNRHKIEQVSLQICHHKNIRSTSTFNSIVSF